jgi:hypothetical protein
VNTARNDGSTVDWGAVADPILATPPWRPRASRRPQVIAKAAADPHTHDWAGRGFTRQGPGSDVDVDYQAGYASGKAEALAGMTTIFGGPVTPFTDGYINSHRQMTEHLGPRPAAGRRRRLMNRWTSLAAITIRGASRLRAPDRTGAGDAGRDG